MVNLVVVMVVCGLLIGVLDVDIYGYFIFWMMGIIDWFIQVELMILLLIVYQVKVILIVQFIQGNILVVWCGLMVYWVLQQFLVDVYWGDLDVLLLDLLFGIGDVVILVV